MNSHGHGMCIPMWIKPFRSALQCYIILKTYVFLAYSVHTHINTYVYMQDVLHHNCQTSRGSFGSKNIINYISLWHVSGYILKNLFNLMSKYSEILIMWHLRKVVPRLVVFLFNRKSFISETGRLMGHVYKGLQECASTVVLPAAPCLPFYQLFQLWILQITEKMSQMTLNLYQTLEASRPVCDFTMKEVVTNKRLMNYRMKQTLYLI
jgi:hypothetical protein